MSGLISHLHLGVVDLDSGYPPITWEHLETRKTGSLGHCPAPTQGLAPCCQCLSPAPPVSG